MGRIVKISNSPDETFQIAYKLAMGVSLPIMIGISGELGTGKTVFAKGFAEGLGVKELITSPTFLGVTESYTGRLPFVHMDFYKKVVTKETINYYLDKKSVLLIEWFENYDLVFGEQINLNTRVYIQYLESNEGNTFDNTRRIIMDSNM